VLPFFLAPAASTEQAQFWAMSPAALAAFLGPLGDCHQGFFIWEQQESID